MFLELLGYLGSGLTIASFIVSGERKLRVLNLAATFFFVIYAIGIGSPSVAILNIVIMVMHIMKISGKSHISLAGQMATLAYAGFSFALVAFLLISHSFSPLETFSFAASLLLLYGLSQDGEERIRPVCMISAFMFVGYSIAIGSIPLLLSNAVLSCVHVYKILQLRGLIPIRAKRNAANV